LRSISTIAVTKTSSADALVEIDDLEKPQTRQSAGSLPAGFRVRRLEKSGTEVEAKGRHAEGGQQADAAKERHDLERLSIALSLCGLTHQNVCDDRVHGNPPSTLDAILIPGVRFKVVSRFSKNGFVGAGALKIGECTGLKQKVR
jgi:hypothetical protein